MLSRRAALRSTVVVAGVGVAAIAANSAGVLDDGLRAVGIRPHAEPDPRDVALLGEAAAGQANLLAVLDAVVRQHDVAELSEVRRILAEQQAAVSDKAVASATAAAASTDQSEALNALADAVRQTATERANGALSAGSLAVIQVLASMAAGLDQVGETVRRIA